MQLILKEWQEINEKLDEYKQKETFLIYLIQTK
jgi:hypothetical protein